MKPTYRCEKIGGYAMSKPYTYQPPYTITPEILNRVAAISEVK